MCTRSSKIGALLYNSIMENGKTTARTTLGSLCKYERANFIVIIKNARLFWKEEKRVENI